MYIRSGGARYPCPAGTYGSESQLRTRACSARCPSGFFCPEGSGTPLECGGTDRFCPLGSAAPRVVPDGFYSSGVSALRRDRVLPCPVGMYCSQGTKKPCPEGTYGATTTLATPKCTAQCPSGSYCPLRTVDPIPCPGGTFGDRIGLRDSSCSGRCQEGFFCPPGSISATQNPCGLGVFCPPGSEKPTSTSGGAYVINGNSAHAKTQFACPIGSFCSGDGTAELCPRGTFGNTSGLTTSRCAGRCAGGHYCPLGSSSAKQNMCGGAHVYCPEGSAIPTPVSRGFYTVGELSLPTHDQNSADASTRLSQRRCEPGHYCVLGERKPCPPGTFGSVFGLASHDCSGLCREGFYCPEGSTTDSAFQCGSSDRFCPKGSPAPTKASSGYCTVNSGGVALDSEGGALTRSAQRIAIPGEFAWRGVCFKCPAGTFGVAEGEVNPRCSGKCSRGYFCPPGSTSPVEKECGGANKYCPEALDAPLSVQLGYYTTKQDEDLCPPGWFRDVSTTTFNSYMDAITGNSPVSVSYGDYSFPLGKCVKCPLGTFKPSSGDDAALCVLCPEFTARSLVDRRSCECFRRAGGPPIDDAAVFGLRFNTATLACEQIPLVTARYAPVEANASVFAKAQQFPCERGYYCQAGVRSPCPGGRYGSRSMETSAECSGTCAAGFYCPLASTNSTAIACGNANVFCPTGSAVPTPVLPGYYSIRSSLAALQGVLGIRQRYMALNATLNEAVRDAQVQCEAGYYCIGGRKFICPSGRYGDRVGETSPYVRAAARLPALAGRCSLVSRECDDCAVCWTVSPRILLPSRQHLTHAARMRRQRLRVLHRLVAPSRDTAWVLLGRKHQRHARAPGPVRAGLLLRRRSQVPVSPRHVRRHEWPPRLQVLGAVRRRLLLPVVPEPSKCERDAARVRQLHDVLSCRHWERAEDGAERLLHCRSWRREWRREEHDAHRAADLPQGILLPPWGRNPMPRRHLRR